MSSSGLFSTRVHPYDSPTSHSCAYEVGLENAQNALVFVGGLGDGPHTVPYPRAIAKKLEESSGLSYSVFEFRMRSSFLGFGFSRLANDVADISALVNYLRGIGKKKVVLMGHSTGSQDLMEYNSPAHSDLAPVDGYILQAPASDRAAISMEMNEAQMEESVKEAKTRMDEGKGYERMPLEFLPNSFKETPISAARWYALAATDGEDNYFSPDLPDDLVSKFWSRITRPFLILHSGEDEYMPRSIDKGALVKHWMKFCRPDAVSDMSGTIPGAARLRILVGKYRG